MSNYVAKGALGAASFKDNYKWENGKCRNVKTGTYYPGDQKLSNCYGFFGPAPSSGGFGASLSFLKDTLLGGGAPYQQGQRPADYSASSLMLPAVVVVGGVALLLILKKKK